MRNKTQEKQIMQMKTISYHQPTRALSIPQQQPPRSISPQLCILSMTSCGYDIIWFGIFL